MNNNRTIYAVVIQQFSIECRKRSKTEVITLANHKGHRRSSKPIRVCGNYLYLVEARENECEWATIGLGFTSDWMNNWREFFKPIVWRNWCKTNHFSSLNEKRSICWLPWDHSPPACAYLYTVVNIKLFLLNVIKGSSSFWNKKKRQRSKWQLSTVFKIHIFTNVTHSSNTTYDNLWIMKTYDERNQPELWNKLP